MMMVRCCDLWWLDGVVVLLIIPLSEERGEYEGDKGEEKAK